MFRLWFFPVLALMCAVPWAVIRLLMRVPLRQVVIESLFVGYIGVLLYVTLFLPFSERHVDTRSGWECVNLIPAHTILGIIRDYPERAILQILGNVVLFVPLGFFLPLLNTRYLRFTMTAAIGLLVSVGIELVQLVLLLLLIRRRSVDVDDVILNVTGACLGYLVWRGAHAIVRLLLQRSEVVEDAA